ncbi:hypothetical protein AB0O39_36285 [Streptomyces anulatus]|uniref:hypothetical protein n=1 Tax=Streptomyces anulatus TaxID=1892 RepID=UPI0034480124
MQRESLDAEGGDRAAAVYCLRLAWLGLGVPIPAGDLVTTDRAAANLDAAAFPGDPDDLFAPLPKPFLSFGVGQHYCLGSWLAQAELQLALHHLARRLPTLRIAVSTDDLRWRSSSLSPQPRPPARSLVIGTAEAARGRSGTRDRLGCM